MIRIDQLIPSTCLLCKKIGFHKTPNLCQCCVNTLPTSQYCCNRCAMPLASPEQTCGVCIGQNLSYESSFSPFLFEGGIKRLMNNLKHQQDICALSSLAAIFTHAYMRAHLNSQIKQGVRSEESKPDIIIPIPLSRKRYFRRGFNQSNELCKILGKKLTIPTSSQILIRAIDTPPQQGLNRRERLKNLENCFQLKERSKQNNFDKQASLKGKTVALLDDVVTTGATMECAAKELKIYGVKKIYAWSIARTNL